MKQVAVLGCTGSVGRSALSLIAQRKDTLAAAVLTAHRSEADLLEQCRRFRPRAACLVAGNERPAGLPSETAWFVGEQGLLEALEEFRTDLVLNAITGAAGLQASAATLQRGCPLALANKESLVMAGPYLTRLAAESGAVILPVDSEHCAIFQCLKGEDRKSIKKIYLTASGGPFRTRPLASFPSITREEALRHPTWEMGPRITIGSATMMNKAFEVLEAHWLFGVTAEQIEVLIHPQSIVHSMVEFIDGSMLAQLGIPDMRVPILYCLSWPDRVPFDFQPFDPVRFRQLEFMPVEPERYPAVPLAYEVLASGGDSGAVLNAADEVLTAGFLAGQVPFSAITAQVAAVVRAHPSRPIDTLDDVLAADRAARTAAEARMHRIKTTP